MRTNRKPAHKKSLNKYHQQIMRRITVFGSSKPKPGDRDYDQALSLGKILGQAGYTVLTGVYIGSM